MNLYQKLPDGTWSDTPIADAIAKIEAEMLNVVNTETTRANLFKDGKMFYSVPIEHLNETRDKEEKAKYLVKDEANYGVVATTGTTFISATSSASVRASMIPTAAKSTIPNPLSPKILKTNASP